MSAAAAAAAAAVNPQEYMDNVIVEAFTFNEEEARAAELAAPAAAALPTEVVRSKVRVTRGSSSSSSFTKGVACSMHLAWQP
jgi:hypothetical protein